MAPIRVGLIGLGATDSDGYRPGEWGVQHMKAINNSSKFELVAVANSSVDSAKKSIKAHNLPETVKAYGSPEDIARDPDVDLVAVAVTVTKHASLVKPALQQKKNVLVEFPVGPEANETRELAKLAKDSGVTFYVGLQGRAAPEFRKLKELVDSKAIGDVVYSSFTGHIPMVVSHGWPQSQTSFLDLKPGASRVTVTLGHSKRRLISPASHTFLTMMTAIDTFVNVLGQFKSIQSLLKVQGKTATLFNSEGNMVDPAYEVTAPDTILVQGVLENGAAVTFSVRSSTTTADDIGFRWIISGTEGEIVFTSGPGIIQMATPDSKIRLRKWGAEAEDIDFSRKESVGDLAGMPLNVARLYEAIATEDKDGYTTIEQSLQTENLLDEIVKSAVWAP